MDETALNGATENVVSEAQGSADLITHAQATDLIRKEKEAAYRKAQREFQAQIEQMKTGQQQSLGGMQLPQEDIVAKAAEQAIAKMQEQFEQISQEQRKQEYSQYVNDQAALYLDKMNKGADLAEDFKEMTARFKPDKFKELFFLANSYDNTPAIIYELGKYPEKLLELDRAMERDPDIAKLLMDRLAESIKFNESAKENNRSAEAPFGRPKPSLNAGTDSGQMSIADLKRSPHLRG